LLRFFVNDKMRMFECQVAATPAVTIATPSPSPSNPPTPIGATSPVKQTTPRVRNTAAANRTPLIIDERLPEGWHRKVSQRKSGASIGRYEVFIISPVSLCSTFLNLSFLASASLGMFYTKLILTF
jgi:Methyl-CpG binding domain